MHEWTVRYEPAILAGSITVNEAAELFLSAHDLHRVRPRR
jgi:hypothetical protein